MKNKNLLARAWKLTFLLLLGNISLFAGTLFSLPDFVQQSSRTTQYNYQTHPYVALPAVNLFSPDPDQLRIQDLRNVDCYAQPDLLQVCGAGDTIPFMLYTKSVLPLQDIRIDVAFGDGIEYAGFAVVDNTVSNTEAQLDTISVNNVEAPSFLLDEVSQAGGGVVLYLGVRAECGVDFNFTNPDITITVSYTNPEGVACTNTVTFEDYGANVIVPRAEIAATPALINLGAPNTLACQSITVTQTTVAASATGYLFTADNYGFDRGITIGEVRLDAVALPATDYTIDPSTGILTLNVNDPTADGLLDFNESQTIQVCYTYGACYPFIDFTPEYTVVTSCLGEVCTGPPDVVTAGNLRSNFPQNPRWEAPVLTEISLPSLSTGDQYVFDVTLEGTGTDPLNDQIESVNFRLRRCQNATLFLDRVQLVSLDGSTVLGTFDPSVYRVFAEDVVVGGTPTRDRAGTVFVDLRLNDSVSGGGLADTDGDGFFDDIPGDQAVRIRLAYGLICEPGDLSCNNTPPAPGGAHPVPVANFGRLL